MIRFILRVLVKSYNIAQERLHTGVKLALYLINSIY